MGKKKSGKKSGGDDKKVQQESEPQAQPQQFQTQQPVPSTSAPGPSAETISPAPSVQQVTEEIPEPADSSETKKKNRRGGRKKHAASKEEDVSEKLGELQISDEPSSSQQPGDKGPGWGDRQERDQQTVASQDSGRQDGGSQPGAKGQGLPQPDAKVRGGGDKRDQQTTGSQDVRLQAHDPYRGSQQPVDRQDRRRQDGDQDRGLQPGTTSQDRGVWQERGLQQPGTPGRGRGDSGQDRRSQPGATDQGRGFRQERGDRGRGSQQPIDRQDRRGQYSDQDRGSQPGATGQGRGVWQERGLQQPGAQGRGLGDRQQHDQHTVGSHDIRHQVSDQDRGSQPGAKGRGRGIRQEHRTQQVGAGGQGRGDRQDRRDSGPPVKDEPYREQPEPGRKQPTTAATVPLTSSKSQPSQQLQKPSVQPPQKSTSDMVLAIPQRKTRKTAGTSGRKIRIEVNHLALMLTNLKTAIHYDVVLDPDTPKRLLRVAVEEFRRKHYPKRYPAFDGRKNLYSAGRLPIEDGFTDEVFVKDDDREKKFKVTIKYAATVDLSVVSRYFESPTSIGRSHQDAIQCIDIVLRSAPSLNLIPVGRSFFTPPTGNIIPLGDGMEMYYGYYQSAILGWKPYLNVDVSHKAFPKSDLVTNIIEELCPGHDFAHPLNPYQVTTVDKFMRTLKVQYEIPKNPASKRIMRINQLDKSAKDAMFKMANGTVVTVDQYFQTEKKYTLKFPHLQCLWVGSKQREQKILIPPELCTILPGQVTQRQMTPLQTSSMIKRSTTSTKDRKRNIMESVRQARYNEDPSVREFGFSVSHDFTQVEARVLNPPMLRYCDRNANPSKGVWRSNKFLNGVKVESWGVLSVDDRQREREVYAFAAKIMECANILGMGMQEANKVSCRRLQGRKPQQELEAMFSDYKDFKLVFVVIPTNLKDVYSYVKQVAELKLGKLTQCVKGRNIYPPKDTTIINILLKVNAKLNGTNYKLDVRPKCLERPCMIMGADVTHPSPESKGSVPSVAAVTASHDPQAFQYNICWRLQPATQEIIYDLEAIVKKHLLFFYKKNNGAKPERIIFFRDGVSEGQFDFVLNSEVSTIRRACTTLGDGSYKPKITFLVVQKRHHTRFFPTRDNDSEDRNFNVPAGTVVDTEITHPTELDFYLVSHASIQGVARPTKYRMLWDDNDMNEDELEQLTYHLCHLFARCTRSVSYPAPTYYAHLAAARAKVYCEKRQINMDALDREFANMTIKKEIVEELPMFFV